MKNSVTRYYLYRIELEKLKHKTWILIVFAKLVLLLVALVNCYVR